MDEPEDDTIQTHLLNKETWLRLLFMILYGIVFEVAKFVGLVAVLVQFLFKLFRGRPLPELQDFGASLGEFYRQIIEFMTFRSEQKPYPWSDWPKPVPEKPETVETPETKPEPAKPARKKPARSRKKPAAGTAAEKKSPE